MQVGVLLSEQEDLSAGRKYSLPIFALGELRRPIFCEGGRELWNALFHRLFRAKQFAGFASDQSHSRLRGTFVHLSHTLRTSIHIHCQITAARSVLLLRRSSFLTTIASHDHGFSRPSFLTTIASQFHHNINPRVYCPDYPHPSLPQMQIIRYDLHLGEGRIVPTIGILSLTPPGIPHRHPHHHRGLAPIPSHARYDYLGRNLRHAP